MSAAFPSSSLLAPTPRTAGSSFTFVHFMDHSLISCRRLCVRALPGSVISTWVFALLEGGRSAGQHVVPRLCVMLLPLDTLSHTRLAVLLLAC